MKASVLIWALIALPMAGSVVCLISPTGRTVLQAIQVGILASVAVTVAAVIAVGQQGPITTAYEWLRLDALSVFHLVVMMVVFALSSLYLPIYYRTGMSRRDARRYGALWFGALAAMTLVLVSNNIGIIWVGIEATTLLTAFLICIHRTPQSVEATWKYLIICSVGVAFAFMGTLLAGAAANSLHLPALQALLWTHLYENAAHLDPVLIKIAFLFLLVGYGTKAGLAPMHSWLPDAHSQAPAPVSALFSGFMLNAALYCIMRYMPLVETATGRTGWGLGLLLLFGVISVLLSAAFILFQYDLKRLLAYCSVEHIGIIAVGLGLGGLGIVAALLHTLNHSLTKCLAFLAAGRLDQMYGTHDINKLGGAARTNPTWGRAMFASMLILIGVAPFAIFISEFLILYAAAQNRAYWTMGLLLLGLAIVFIGMLRHAITIAWGASDTEVEPEKTRLTEKLLVGCTLALLLLLGLWLPGPLWRMLNEAAAVIKGVA